jgi:hypothetical protein
MHAGLDERFLSRSAGNAEEILAISDSESAVALGDVCGDRESGST